LPARRSLGAGGGSRPFQGDGWEAVIRKSSLPSFEFKRSEGMTAASRDERRAQAGQPSVSRRRLGSRHSEVIAAVFRI